MSNPRIVNERVKDLDSLYAAMDNMTKEAKKQNGFEVEETPEEPTQEPVAQEPEQVSEPETTDDYLNKLVEERTSSQVDPPADPPTDEPEEEEEEAPAQATVEEQVPEEDFYAGWDTDEPSADDINTEVGSPTEVDYSSFANELGFDASSKEELVSKINELKEGSDQAIPEDLKKAIELYKEGVDYRQALGIDNTDYDKISDADLYANSVINYFQNPDGTIREEALQEHVDSLSDVELQIKADEVRRVMNSQREQMRQALINQANDRKERAISGIKDAVSKLEDVNGFKVSPYQKQKIVEAVSNDTLIKDLFYSGESIDYSKAAKIKFISDNFDKITNFLKSKSLNDGKRQVLQTMSNVEKPGSSRPAQTATQKKSVADVQKGWLADLKEKSRQR